MACAAAQCLFCLLGCLVSYMPLAQCGRKILQCEPVEPHYSRIRPLHTFLHRCFTLTTSSRFAALKALLHTLQAASLDARRRRRTAQINR